MSGRRSASRSNGDRVLFSLAAILLALAAIIALASRSGDIASERTTSRTFVRKPALSSNHPTFSKAGVKTVKKQSLAEAFSSYNKKTGYLVSRYWDWGFDVRFYLNVDNRVPIGDLVKIYEPEGSLYLKHLDLDNYTAFKDKVGPSWYPPQEAPRSAKIVGIVRGVVKIDQGGNYTFNLKSNTGATFNVSDMKTDSSVVAGVDDETVNPIASTSIVLKGPQMVNVEIYWHSPPVGTEHVLHLTYSGPDTDDVTVDAAGAHWLNDKENPKFKRLDPATLHPGFGCRLTYPKKARSEVPEDLNGFRNQTPDWVAQCVGPLCS